jgi:hypothetical protein
MTLLNRHAYDGQLTKGGAAGCVHPLGHWKANGNRDGCSGFAPEMKSGKEAREPVSVHNAMGPRAPSGNLPEARNSALGGFARLFPLDSVTSGWCCVPGCRSSQPRLRQKRGDGLAVKSCVDIFIERLAPPVRQNPLPCR